MKTIEGTAIVTGDRRLTIRARAPDGLPPGEHRVVLVVEDAAIGEVRERTCEDWPVHDAGLTTPSLSLRREDLYGNDGR